MSRRWREPRTPPRCQTGKGLTRVVVGSWYAGISQAGVRPNPLPDARCWFCLNRTGNSVQNRRYERDRLRDGVGPGQFFHPCSTNTRFGSVQALSSPVLGGAGPGVSSVWPVLYIAATLDNAGVKSLLEIIRQPVPAAVIGGIPLSSRDVLFAAVAQEFFLAV